MPLDNNPDSNSEINALKNQVFALLVAMVVVTGSFTVYLFRQDSMLGKQCNQIDQAINQLSQNRAAINSFVYNVMVYGQKHPEFMPLLKKYGIAPGAATLPPPNTPGK